MTDPIGAAALHSYIDYAAGKNNTIEGQTAISQKRLVAFTDDTGKLQVACWDWDKKDFFDKCFAVLGIGKYSTN